MCKTLQGKETVYESDLFSAVIERIQKLTGVQYINNQRRIRIVADHLRTALRLAED
jgi:alanyl-tRNA synthetase